MALFVVLAALVALLAVPVWRGMKAEPAPGAPAALPAESAARPPNRALILSQRAALVLAAAGLGLTLLLVLGVAARPARLADTRRPFSAARAELGALARLAESSVAQGEELTRERDVRRRAEEDARLKQQLLTQSLDERVHLGRDLHDGIIQSLYAAGLTLESVRALLHSDPAEAERRLETTRASLNATIREVRARIVGLAPENLRRTGFANALESLVTELRAGRETEFELAIDDDAAATLSPDQSVEVLQIAREAVSNALRHGQAARITVRLHAGDRELALLVQDNGRGFEPAHGRDGGHGLGNMRARAEQLGATLQFTSRPGAGTRVLLTVPILVSHPA
jgi:signal transduction histidine kinase